MRAAAAALALLLVAAGCSREPDLVFLNGKVVTLDEARPSASAVALRGDRILAVGSDAEMGALAGPRTQRVDLEGHALLPGFVDAHSHFSLTGQVGFTLVDLRPPPMGPFDSIAAIQLALRRRAERSPPGAWVVGAGYDDTLLAEGRHPTRADLDAVSTTQPVVAFHISLHIAVANSAALAAAGIDRNTPQPEGGVIRLDRRGEPDGVLEELPALGLLMAAMPTPPLAVRLQALARAGEIYAAAGVTTAQEGAADQATIELLFRADQAGMLPVRVIALPLPPVARALHDGELALGLDPDAHLELGAAKVIADGSIQGYTAWLRQPYHTAYRGDPSWRGFPAMPREQLEALVDELYADGFQVAIHANGDAAIDDALAALRKARAAHPRRDDRPILIHAQMAQEDQLDAMRELGVVPSFFALHVYYWGDRHRKVFLGPERAARISPAASALARGMHFTLHTDAPVVRMQPLRLVETAVTRETTGAEVLGPEQRIPVEAALRAITLDAAWQHCQEADKGSITPGKLADLVVLSESPLEVEPAHIHEIRVLRTLVGGETVYLR